MATKPYIIALEEHYFDPEVKRHITGLDATNVPRIVERLDDVGALRLKEMDEAGIDLQVLSHRQSRAAKAGCRDRCRTGARRQRPALRNGARASRPVCRFCRDPDARSEGGGRRARAHGYQVRLQGRAGERADQRALSRRQAVLADLRAGAGARRAALYAPSIPHPAVIEAYYKDYVEQYPSLLRAAWGFTVETATQGVRLVLSGVFDAYPGLKIILGHLGEGLPFYLWRISMGLARDGKGGKSFRDTFCEHFYITTSGFFSDPALLCCMMEMGIDRILFSVDYPFVDNPPGTKWTETLPLCAEDKEKLLSGNAKRLLKIE